MSETVSATFTTLFDRSRYSSQGRWFGLEEGARKKLVEQQERFAVGMIGFALERDSKFRAHFLGRVCGLKDLPGTSSWEILVEPENWGDLVLKHRATSSLLVAEFKIGANLEEHQNPSADHFYLPARNGKKAGYGWEIAQFAKQEKWLHLKYVTVENSASWKKARKVTPDFRCVPGEWRPSSKRRKASAVKRLKQKLTYAGIGKIREKDWFLEVFCKPEGSPGDMDWFIKVLTALNK
jgi:hypothetical protein